MTWLTERRERLERFRRGEAAVLAEVYEQYAPELARTLAAGFRVESGGRGFRCQGLTGPFELDDLLQETFLKAFSESARAAYDGLRPFSGWLFTIARNLVVDRHRSAASRLLVPLDDEAEPAESPEPSPEHAAIAGQFREVYAAFLASLTEPERLLVKLRFEDEAPRRAVEEATGLSAMQVRTRESKLRAQLYERLLAAGFEEAAALAALLLLLGGAS